MIRPLVPAFSLVMALSACSGQAPQGANNGDAAAEPPSPAAASLFQTEIAPTLQTACATCHLTGQEAGNMSLIPSKAIATLVNVDAIGAKGVKRIVPGDPDASYVIMKLEGTHTAKAGIGGSMPFGAPKLPPEKIASFRRWIAEGAKP